MSQHSPDRLCVEKGRVINALPGQGVGGFPQMHLQIEADGLQAQIQLVNPKAGKFQLPHAIILQCEQYLD